MSIFKNALSLCLLFILILIPLRSVADDFKPLSVNLNRTTDKSERLRSVKLKTKNLKIIKQGSSQYSFYSIRLVGKFLSSKNDLYINGEEIKRNSKKFFKFNLPIVEDTDSFTLEIRSPSGRSKSEEVSVLIRKAKMDVAEEKEEEKDEPKSSKYKEKKFNGAFGIAGTTASYSQTNLGSLSFLYLTLKGGLSYRFSKKIDAGLSGYYNLLSLSSPGPTQKITFMGFNLRAGYRFMFGNDMSLTIAAGWYLVDSMNPNNNFGFRKMNGPQLYPTLYKKFSNRGHAGSLYIKFSPVFGSGFGSINFSNNELAIGASYAFPAFGQRFSAGVDYSKLSLTSTIDSISLSTISFGISYLF